MVALMTKAALSVGAITDTYGLAAYTVLLMGYLYAEARNLWTHDAELFWINPAVLASILTFAIAFCFTNILFFMPEDLVAMVGIQTTVTPWMNQLMLLVILGALAMWGGYGSAIGRRIGRMLKRSHTMRRLLCPSVRISKIAFCIFLGVSLTARLLTVKFGVFGYSSTYDQVIAGAAFREYLSMAESLGKLALVGVAMQCFAARRFIPLDWMLLWLVFGYEVLFGFLSGFKSAVVMPFIIVGIVHYGTRKRFPRWWLPGVVAAILASYAVIEPFRANRNMDKEFVGTDLGSIVTTMTGSGRSDWETGRERSSVGLSFLARSNLTYFASQGIEYAANNRLQEDSPQFLRDIVLAPVHAVIPRFLWSGKPLGNIGLWYTKEVMGFNVYSSTAMSPFTYLNFAGGPLAVILGFLLVGICQRGLFDGLRGAGGGGLVVLCGMLGTLSNIDSAFNAFIIMVIRLLPILVIAQYVLLESPQRARRVSRSLSKQGDDSGLPRT
jgi:hypothetical protein